MQRFPFSSLLGAASLCVASMATAGTPNLVVVFMDDMGYADVSSFGATEYETPNLDRLAAEGRKFTNFHVAQPVCSASRAALLTGCYPNRIGIHGALSPKVNHGLHPDEVTLAELARQKGYATGAFGKWHLGHLKPHLPLQHGFDEYYGLPYSNDMWPFHPTAKPGSYPKLPMIEGDEVVDEDVTPEDQKQLTHDYTERAVQFIERSKDRPFFCYLAHSMTHVPLFVSEAFEGKSGKGLYADVMLEIDWSMGRIMETLEKHGLTDNTWVVFTSDNGPWLSYGDHGGSSGPFREGKGTSWEGGTRVTGIMRYPEQIPAGTSTNAMCMTTDLLPTFARLIDADLPDHPIDGVDIWPLITGEARSPKEFYSFYYGKNQLQAITSGDGRWKLVLPHTYRTLNGAAGGSGGTPVKYESNKVTEIELYDLENDPGETTDVAAAHGDQVTQMLQWADEIRAELGDSATKTVGSGIREPGRVE